MDRKILVTGAAGFIGFHLSQKLLSIGESIIGLDNLNDYYDVNLKQARLEQLASQKGFHFLKLDLADRARVVDLFTQYKPELVIHLAAQAGVRYSLSHPHAYVDSNLVGFVNILEGCRQAEVKHLVFASSSSVYGANTKIPFSVSDRTDYPVSLYAATKRANELIAYTYSHLYGIPTTGLRFFTVYGPWGRPDMAYFSFTQSILAGKPIEVFNNGNMRRDFTYIDDIIEGIVHLLDYIPLPQSSDPLTEASAYKIYNIGNNKPINLLKFIEVLENLLGVKSQKILLPMQPGDVTETYADIDDLIRDVGFKPSTSIEIGLSHFIAWYRDYYNI
jgi:UDP-glucuronate 4-epimerase